MLRRNFIKGLLFSPIAFLLPKRANAQIAEKGMNLIEAFNKAVETGGILKTPSHPNNPTGNLFYIRTITHPDACGGTISRKVLSSSKDTVGWDIGCELNEFFLNGKWEVIYEKLS